MSTWLKALQNQEGEAVVPSLRTSSFANLSLVTVLTILVIYHLVQRANTQRAQNLFEKRHGCGAPPPLLYKWPFAIDIVIEAFRSLDEKRTLPWFQEMFDRTGATFEQKIFGSKSIDTVEPANLESILSTDFSSYGLGTRIPTFRPLLGDGIFTQDATPWKHSRDMLRPLFSLNRANIFTQVEMHTEHLVNCIPSGEFIDLQPLFFRFTFDTTTFLLFGKSMNSLQGTSVPGAEQSREAKFFEAFRISQDFLFRRGRIGGLYWLIGGKEFHKNNAIVHQFVDEAIQEALSIEYQDGKVADVYCFLDALVQETRDPKVVRDQLLNVLLAGRDTTACCLTWTFRLLAQHPPVLAKLRKEISSLVGVGKDSSLPDRNILKKMKYLNMVIKEVLRLYPSVPINSRTSLKDTTLPMGGGPDGTQPLMVRKGASVGYTVYVMHRLKKLYGEDAESFRPERWDPDLDNAVDLKNIGWGYLPFNGGPRICLGQEFALVEASYVIVRILQKFRSFELDPRDRDVPLGTEKQEVSLVLASTDGCRVKAVE